MKALFCLLQGCLLLFVFMVLPMHAVQADGWYWLSSDSKYSKYFDPSSVVVSHKAATGHGDVATEIAAWTKTAYSYEGAQETIENYGLNYLLPDPSKLSYSLAEVIINPQNRTIQYAKRIFTTRRGRSSGRKSMAASRKSRVSSLMNPFTMPSSTRSSGQARRSALRRRTAG